MAVADEHGIARVIRMLIGGREIDEVQVGFISPPIKCGDGGSGSSSRACGVAWHHPRQLRGVSGSGAGFRELVSVSLARGEVVLWHS